jgi:hypothetical protein
MVTGRDMKIRSPRCRTEKQGKRIGNIRKKRQVRGAEDLRGKGKIKPYFLED